MRFPLPAALAALMILFPGGTTGQVITTVVGGGPDDLPALSANLAGPRSVAVDQAGNLYIAVPVQERIFQVDPQGHLTVFAGSGIRGGGGDGGTAREAMFHGLTAITLDEAGNMFCLETGTLDERAFATFVRIRRIDAATRIVSTIPGGRGIAGTGPARTESDVVPFGGIALDASGNVFFIDTVLRWVRRVDAVTLAVTTVAGGGASQEDGIPGTSAFLLDPVAVTVDAAGAVYVVELSARRVRRIDGTTGLITTVAGNGTSLDDGIPAADARLQFPWSLALDSAANLYIGDSARLRRVDAATGVITTIAGSGTVGYSGDGGPATSATLTGALGIALDVAGDIFLAGAGPGRVRRVDGATGTITTVAGNGRGTFDGEGGPAARATLRSPYDVAFDRAGNMFISDAGHFSIRRVDRSTGALHTMANLLMTPNLIPLEIGAIAVNKRGDVFLADLYDNPESRPHIVRKVEAGTGAVSIVAGNGWGPLCAVDGLPATSVFLFGPTGLALDQDDNLLIAQPYCSAVRRMDAATSILTTVAGVGYQSGFDGDGGPATAARLSDPRRIATDRAGNLFIADVGNSRVRRVDAATGIITTVAGNGSATSSGDGGAATDAGFSFIWNLAVDAAGNLFITDFNRVRRVDADTGIITAVAGSDVFGFTGDGGPPQDASLAYPSGLAINLFGSLFIADTLSHRIRKVSTCATDTESPSIAVTLTPAVLQPMNHKMRAISAVVEATDDCVTPLVRLTSISSSEPDDAPGNADGSTVDDIQEAEFGTADFEFSLRAERIKDGPGRVYTIVYTAEDEAGNKAPATATVIVPRSRVRPRIPRLE